MLILVEEWGIISMDENMVNNCCEETTPLGEKCHLTDEDLLNDMSKEFNATDIYEYRNLLMIIRNEFFLKPEASQTNKYKIFAILENIAKVIEEEKYNAPQVDINNMNNAEYSIDELYSIFCSNRLQSDEPFLIVNIPEHYTLKGCN